MPRLFLGTVQSLAEQTDFCGFTIKNRVKNVVFRATQTDRYNDTVALFQGVLAVKRLF